jgi:SAM-dependent methyltransferase
MDRDVYRRIAEVEQDHWWFTARRAILADQIGRMGLPAGARILEIGCGTGGNLAMLRQFGEVSAVEPDDDARAHAAAKSGVPVRPGLLPDGLPDFEGPFDLAAAFDVIEHVDEDAASVAAIGRLLKPGGRLIATVPANAWMWSDHDARHHHKRRYDLAQFSGVVRAAGLEIAKASYFNTLLFPAIGAVRLAKAALKAKGGDDEAMPSPPLNRALHTLFAAETGLLRSFNLPFGVSILLIARRPA